MPAAGHPLRSSLLPAALAAVGAGAFAWLLGAAVDSPAVSASAATTCLVLLAATGAWPRPPAAARIAFAGGLTSLALPATVAVALLLGAGVLVHPSTFCGNGITFLALFLLPVAALFSFTIALGAGALAQLARVRGVARVGVWPALVVCALCAAWAALAPGWRDPHAYVATQPIVAVLPALGASAEAMGPPREESHAPIGATGVRVHQRCAWPHSSSGSPRCQLALGLGEGQPSDWMPAPDWEEIFVRFDARLAAWILTDATGRSGYAYDASTLRPRGVRVADTMSGPPRAWAVPALTAAVICAWTLIARRRGRGDIERLRAATEVRLAGAGWVVFEDGRRLPAPPGMPEAGHALVQSTSASPPYRDGSNPPALLVGSRADHLAALALRMDAEAMAACAAAVLATVPVLLAHALLAG
jgi:hypothetical protein